MAESQSKTTVDDATQMSDHGVMTDALHSPEPGNVHQSKDHGVENSLREDYEAYSGIGNDAEAADALIALAQSYTVQSKYPEAESALIEANNIHSRIGNDIGTGNACFHLGRLYSEQCKYEEAERSYRSALAAYDRGDDSGDNRATAIAGLATVYKEQGKYSEAEECATESLAIWKSLADEHSGGGALLLLSLIFNSQSKYEEEKEALLQAEFALGRTGDTPRRAAILDRLGENHVAQADYTGAEKYYRAALAMYSSTGDNRGVECELISLAALYARQGRREEAEQYIAQARATRVPPASNDEGQADASLPSPQTSKSQPTHNEQEEALIQAKATLAESCSSESRARTLGQLGEIRIAQAKYTDAEECYRLAQPIFSSIGDELSVAFVSSRLAFVYFQLERFEEAEACAAQARVSYATIADDDGEARALDLLMSLKLLQGKLAEAEEVYREVREIYTRLGRPMGMGHAITRAFLVKDSEDYLIPLAATILRSDFPLDV